MDTVSKLLIERGGFPCALNFVKVRQYFPFGRLTRLT